MQQSSLLLLNALLLSAVVMMMIQVPIGQNLGLSSMSRSTLSTVSTTTSAPRVPSSACSSPSAALSRVRVFAQEKQQQLSRREMMTFGGLTGAATISSIPKSAQAGLFGPSQREKYEQETSAFLKLLQDTLAIPSSDDAKKEAVLNLKAEGNRWVAKWRNSKMSSSPSFGNLYSVINAVNGHYNTFGPQSNLPKKRMARVDKEIADATKYLAKGR
mmetsp:Transcript_6075/g.7441  ORF Transcript_6075/g.7441 Transcript_6075/m.7441 type:complete len:215 (-) Transcript_6075:217-861(-)|eukprot:jgi/Bigna1/90613/estExt_fgenesh1_pg.C_740077